MKATRLMYFLIWFLSYQNSYSQSTIDTVKVDWNKVVSTSKTTATLQLVENPMVRPSSPIHTPVFKALKDLNAEYLRYVPWFPYPKMAVAELEPPTETQTFWDFTYLDSTMHAVMKASEGHKVVIGISTIPAWLWKTKSKVTYPTDPYQTCWTYNEGTELRDSTAQEVANYFARVLSWYTKGGFTDELGKYHKSGYFYKIPYWEVLNEPDSEHNISPELYTKIYDAVVLTLKKIAPEMKFVGISVASVNNPQYFEYFLNPKNHRKGVPLEGISYHHYSLPAYKGQTIESCQYTFFDKADAFLVKAKYIESIRKRLAPNVFTMINEIGVILRHPQEDGAIPTEYWNLAGAMYAHIYLELNKLGIDVAGESQLVGYPTQFPDVSMVNWETGQPNARYWILKLIKDHFNPGDKLVSTSITGGNFVIGPPINPQAFITAKGKRILLINKKNTTEKVVLPTEVIGGTLHSVDVDTQENPPVQMAINQAIISLKPFSVSVIELK
jgi:hypothetical protein